MNSFQAHLTSYQFSVSYGLYFFAANEIGFVNDLAYLNIIVTSLWTD